MEYKDESSPTQNVILSLFIPTNTYYKIDNDKFRKKTLKQKINSWAYYRGTHKGCDFSDDIRLPKSSDFEGSLVFSFFYDPCRRLRLKLRT